MIIHWFSIAALIADSLAQSSLFSNSVYVPFTQTLVGSPHASADAEPVPTGFNVTQHQHLLMQYDRDVVAKFASDNDTRVHGAKRSSLSCAALAAKEKLEFLDFDWDGLKIHVHKTSYQHFPEFNDRSIFFGQLAGTDSDNHAFTGFATITWNGACDPKVFHVSIVLNTQADQTRVLKSVPCSSSVDVPNCTWLAHVQTTTKDEMEKHDPHRRSLMATAKPSVKAALTPKSKDGRDNGYVVKVIWFYTPAVQAVWSDEKIKSMITAGVVTANYALQQSQTGLQLECVGMFLTDGYDINNHQQTLDDLNNGRVPGVNQKRDVYRADLVQLVIDDSQWCGLGNVLTDYDPSFAAFAFSTVYSQCFSTYSHIHEISHNMGCQHDIDDAGPATTWNYGYGLRYCDQPSTFRTIMSYSCNGSTRVPFFSNPDVYYQGRPTGTATANNAQVIRYTKETVSNFRTG
jgi:hypothetical protein